MFGTVLHSFQRNQNVHSGQDLRLGNRATPFLNTMTLLEDPDKQRKLYLIGSTHSSTLLANRTRELIQEVKPDSLYVQTNQKWWDIAQQIHDVHNQTEMNHYAPIFREAFNFSLENGARNFRNTVFWARLYTWLYQMDRIRGFGNQFNMFTPGLEMKLAIEEAQKHNAKIVFGGLAVNDSDIQALKVETRMDPLSLFTNFRKSQNQIRWNRERADLHKVYEVLGGEAFGESFDRTRANWVVQYFEKIAPYQKRILLDTKNETIFKSLYRGMPGQTIVAVVNQWHMEGIENFWRYATKTQLELQPINPIGDMDLEAYHEDLLVNDALRTFVSRLTKSEPATGKSHLMQYFKDCQEQERTRHVEFDSHDDPHMYHGTPYEDGYQHHNDRLPEDQRPKPQDDKHKHH